MNDIVFGFARVAERKAEIREERKRRAEEERERERTRHQKIVAIQKEEERIKRLHEEVHRWVQSEQLRSYVTARIKSAEQGQQPVDQEWVDWALAQADRLDPLRPSPASIVGEKVRLW
ncbi:MAG: hypothetical protein SFV18_14780 [Bryobacteraceae bacterium]|nr:hypothetical protein [Bryobacteraceae bacterium]